VNSISKIWPSLTSPYKTDPALEKRIDDLLSKMSLESKIGQMIQGEIRSITPDDIRKYRLGSVLSGGGTYPNNDRDATAEQWLDYADTLYEASMSENGDEPLIPVIWGIDAVHGHNNYIGATIFPHNIGLGAMNNPAIVEAIGRATALETAATGIDWIFAPTLAVVQDLRWGRSYESYSASPEIVAAYAKAVVDGIQGALDSDLFQSNGHLIATAKHFLGDGGTWRGLDQGDNRDTEQDLSQIHAAGYYTALDAGVLTVMASFSSWQGEKLHGHRHLLTDVLKRQLDFDGFVVGDWNGHGQVPGCDNTSCPQAVDAGIDMFMVPQDWKALYENTLAQARDGRISMDRIDDAVRRILRVKIRAGLFDQGKPSTRLKNKQMIGRDEHKQLARKAVRHSLVLLKNNDGVLPLEPGATVLVVGAGADDIGQQSGGWTISWQGKGNKKSDFPGGYSVLDGIREVVTAAGGQVIYRPDGTFSESVDYAIAVYGENPYAEMHGDVVTLEHQPGNKQDLKALRSIREQNIPLVSIFLSGRPMWMNPEINQSDAFVAAWLPGSQGGAIADVIFKTDGAHDFTGKLPFAWPNQPARSDDHPELGQGSSTAPLFPIGYGLSYRQAQSQLDSLSEAGMAAELGESDQVVLFDRDPIIPWQLFLQESGDNSIKVLSSIQNGLFGTIKVLTDDRQTQGDIRTVSWTGERKSRVYLAINNTLDFSEYRSGSIDFDLLIKNISNDTVIAMGAACGNDCEGLIKLESAQLKEFRGDWQRISLPIECLASKGLNLQQVSTALIIESATAAEVSFGRIVLNKKQGGGTNLGCE